MENGGSTYPHPSNAPRGLQMRSRKKINIKQLRYNKNETIKKYPMYDCNCVREEIIEIYSRIGIIYLNLGPKNNIFVVSQFN